MAVEKLLRNSEKAVLGALEQGARRPFSAIAKHLKTSQQLVSYLVNAIEKKGIMKGYYTLIDYSKLDVLNFQVYLKVSYINKEKFDTLVEFLAAEPHTGIVLSCGGRYDIICSFFAKNPSQFNKACRAVIEKFPEQIKDYIILTIIVNRDFGRKYLFKDSALLMQNVIGGDREPEEIDETDMKILDALSQDARKNAVMIGQNIDLTPKSIIERIKKLHSRRIIKGFRPMIYPRKMGIIPILLLIKYHNISVNLENEMINFLKFHPAVVSILKTLGEWDIEIRIETLNQAEFRKTEIEIRQKFATLIQQIESIPIYKAHKVNYFPKFLLENKKK